jgi:UDP-glucose 4-epimerase
MVLGYDPLFHVIQEEDVVTALQLALEKRLRGIFNVAGPPPVPFSVIIRETGRTAVPLPGPVLAWLMGRFGFPRLSEGALAHIKYPIVVDSSPFREATGFRYAHDEGRIIRIFRESSPPPGAEW